MSSTPNNAEEAEATSAPSATPKTSEAAEAFFEKTSPTDGASVGGEALSEGIARYSGRRPVWRSSSLLILVIGVSGWLLFSMRADLAYFFTDPDPIDLGDIDHYDMSLAEPNAFARIDGMPREPGAQYKQFGKRYRVYQLIGTRVFVREPLRETEADEDDDGAHPTRGVEGRLLEIREERTFANVRAFFEQTTRFNFNDTAWILLAEVTPRSLWWVPVAYVALGVILLLNLFLLGKRVFSRKK